MKLDAALLREARESRPKRASPVSDLLTDRLKAMVRERTTFAIRLHEEIEIFV